MTWGEADRFYARQLRGIWAFKLAPESWKVFNTHKSRSGVPLTFGRINLHSQAVKGILRSTPNSLIIFDTESHLSFGM